MDITWFIDKVTSKVKSFKRKPEKKEHDFHPPISPGPDIIYAIQYGAWYCADTGEWLTKKCDDPECKWCKDRPEKGKIWV